MKGLIAERRRLGGLALGQPGLEPVDVMGRFIRIGDVVRVVGVPSLEGMAPESIRELEPVFARLVGRYLRVNELTEQGMLGAWFSTKKGRRRSRQCVALEPWLVRVRRSRGRRRRRR